MTKEDFQAIKGEPEWIPCSACRASVFIARHERTGKPAPLLRPREGGPKPNIVAWQGVDGWQYKIVKENGEFINHFADCPAAAQFRKRGEQTHGGSLHARNIEMARSKRTRKAL